MLLQLLTIKCYNKYILDRLLRPLSREKHVRWKNSGCFPSRGIYVKSFPQLSVFWLYFLAVLILVVCLSRGTWWLLVLTRALCRSGMQLQERSFPCWRDTQPELVRSGEAEDSQGSLLTD